MCDYLAGSMNSSVLASSHGRENAMALARSAGYHVQFDAEVPGTIRTEIGRYAVRNLPAVLFNITSRQGEYLNCIDETLGEELDYSTKKPLSEVRFFSFLKSLFDLAHPTQAVLIFVDGAESGWFPLERRRRTLVDFLALLYEYYDRPDWDVCGVYDIEA